MSVLEISGTVDTWLNKDDRKLICIEFYSQTSENCRRIVMHYNRLARTYPQAVFLRLDVDAQSKEASRFHIDRVPAFLFFYCGEEKERYVGTDEYILEAIVQQYSQINRVPISQPASDQPPKREVPRRVETKRMEPKGRPSIRPSGELRRQGSAAGNVPQPHRLGTNQPEKAASHSPLFAPKPKLIDPFASLRRSLADQGFTSDEINSAFRLTDKRDLASLSATALLVRENTPKQPSSEWEAAEHLLHLSKSQLLSKQREKAQQKSDSEVRANEAAKAQKKQEEEEEHRKRVIQQFNSDHNFAAESPTFDTSAVEKAVILVDSIFAQSQFNVGRTALRMIRKILANTELSDPKYRSIRKDSETLRKTVGMATGGIALLNIAGFQMDGDSYVMRTRNDALVNGIIRTIDRRMFPSQS